MINSCSVSAIDAGVFNGLVKRWLRELKDSADEMLEALFVFQNIIAGSTKQISCRLCNSINQITDGFSPCKVSAKPQEAGLHSACHKLHTFLEFRLFSWLTGFPN